MVILDFKTNSLVINSHLNDSDIAYLSRLTTKLTMWLCAQWKLRSADAQADLSLRCLLEES